MHYEENCMTYVEDEGCCNAVMYKLSKKRNFILVTVLLVLAVISILAGLFNGFTLKKYSDLALTIGIFVPSIILVLICVYLAYICGRESFRSSMLSRINHLSGGNCSHPDRDFQKYPRMDSATRDNLRVRYQQKVGTVSLNYPLEARPPSGKTDYNASETVDYCEAKISRKHIRSFSNSDISRRAHRNPDSHSKKPERYKFSSRVSDVCQHLPRFHEHQDVNQRKEFRRSVSDTTNRNRHAKLREDRCTWNTYSLDKLRKHVVKINTSNDAGGKNKFESYETVRPSEFLHCQENLDNIEACEKSDRFKEYKGYDERFKNGQQEKSNRFNEYRGNERFKNGQQDYVNTNREKGILEENCYTKSEIRLYSSSVLNPPYEYKQTFRFSSFRPDKNDVKDSRDIASSSNGDEKASSFTRRDTLGMERKGKKLENFPSEDDAYRRKAVYFPSTSSKESTLSSPDYVHEHCKYTKKKNKETEQQFSRGEDNFEKLKNDQEVRFQWQ